MPQQLVDRPHRCQIPALHGKDRQQVWSANSGRPSLLQGLIDKRSKVLDISEEEDPSKREPSEFWVLLC